MVTELSLYRLPREVKEAIAAMDNDFRLKIIEYLMNNEKLYLIDLRKKLNLSNAKGDLEQQLLVLSKAGLIDRYTPSLDDRRDERSYYKLSPFAIKLINGILFSLEPIESLANQIEEQPEVEKKITLKAPLGKIHVKKMGSTSKWQKDVSKYFVQSITPESQSYIQPESNIPFEQKKIAVLISSPSSNKSR